MRSTEIRVVTLAAAVASALAFATAARADADQQAEVVTVAFGAGLNTAQPGNSANHHVLPNVIRIAPGDVVNFVVAGLHVIRAYDNGVRLQDVQLQIPDECEVNPVPPAMFPPQCSFGVTGPVPVIPPLGLAVYYEGINPTAPPPATPPPPFAQPSIAVNRVESVRFLEPGRYLVICAVLPHFNDGMRAWVEVRPENHGHAGIGHDHTSADD